MTIEIDRIIKNLTLAAHDGEIKGIVVAYITDEGNKLEFELSFVDGQAYAINTGLDLLKAAVLERIRTVGAAPWRDRE